MQDLQYKMFLLNLKASCSDFTLLSNLQYKMFLLNVSYREIRSIKTSFTIQNVPIKLAEYLNNIMKDKYLQYKMFLLNLIFLKLPI